MNEEKKKGLSTLDAFLIIGVILVVIGMIGQNAAVYLMDQKNKAESFEVSFVVRSYEKNAAGALMEAQNASETGLACTVGDTVVGYIGTLHQTDILVGNEGSDVNERLCDMTGILLSSGKSTQSENLLYGYGAIAPGDVLVVSVQGKGVTLEITGVNVKKIEKST